MSAIHPSTLQFLSDLAAHNDREWFAAHRDAYEAARKNAADFAAAFLRLMQDHDRLTPERPGAGLYRIHNDLRFHKNKPIFNTRFAGGFHRLKPHLRGGYYWHIESGKSYVSCGFFGPNPDDLKRIRQDIDHNWEEWEELLALPQIRDTFGEMQGDQVKNAPSGYPKDHPGIRFLRYKQFIFRHYFTDAEVLSPDFVQQANACFRNIRPWFDFMSEVLTTDSNGESIL